MSRAVKAILLIVVVSAGCSSNPAAPDSALTSPAWLTTVVRQLETEPVANPPAFIARYEYKGDTCVLRPAALLRCDECGVSIRRRGHVQS